MPRKFIEDTDFVLQCLEGRILFYLSILPRLEEMCNEINEKRQEIKDTDTFLLKDMTILYVRLFEVHERILLLTTKLIEKKGEGIIITKEESELLKFWETLSDQDKEDIKLNYGKSVNERRSESD